MTKVHEYQIEFHPCGFSSTWDVFALFADGRRELVMVPAKFDPEFMLAARFSSQERAQSFVDSLTQTKPVELNVRRYLTKSRNGHWRLTIVNTDTGDRVYSDKYGTRHQALTEEDDLMARLRQRDTVSDAQLLAAIGPCGK